MPIPLPLLTISKTASTQNLSALHRTNSLRAAASISGITPVGKTILFLLLATAVQAYAQSPLPEADEQALKQKRAQNNARQNAANQQTTSPSQIVASKTVAESKTIAASNTSEATASQGISHDSPTLEEVQVSTSAQPQSSIGPVKGYRASRSQTATKTNAALIETPQAITVIGAEQMREQGAKTLAEAIRSVAGVDAGQRGRRGFDDFSIRGFVQTSYLLRDGMRVDNEMWIQNELFGLERIDVLKGPGSVLYGQIAPGGLINLVSKRPTDKPIADIGMGLGNYNHKQWTADFSDSLNASGSVRYRLTAISSASDDQVNYVDRQRTYVAPALTWDISDKTSLTVLANYQKDDYVRIQGLPALGTVLPNRNGSIPYSRFIGVPGFDGYSKESTQIGYSIEHAFSDKVSFKQNLRYIDYTVDGRFANGTTVSNNQLNLTRSGNLQQVDAQVLTVDNQLGVRFDTGALSHDVLLGLDQFRFESKRVNSTVTMNALNLFNPVYTSTLGPLTLNRATSGNDDLVQTGFYAQDHIRIAQRWNLVAGLRHDKSKLVEERLDSSRNVTNPSATTGRIGLLYAHSSGWSPYVSYSESFLPVTGSKQDGSSLDPETGQQRELGLKYETADKRFGAGAALYDLRRQNVTNSVTDSSGTFNVQTGEQRHRGLELEANGRLTDKLNLVATYTYIDAEVSKSTQGNEGLRPIQVPKNMANAWLTYDLAPALQGLSVGGGLRYIGVQAGNNLNTFDVPDYTLLDAAIYYRTGPWRLALNGRNLADKQYIASCFPTNFTTAVNNVNCGAGDPRMVMLSANYSFK